MTELRQRHWDDVYATRNETEVSWFQADPARSVTLIRTHVSDRAAPIIDMGGGASRLVDALSSAGFSDLTVLDISGTALAAAKQRMGDEASKVRWIVSDVTEWKPQRQWHVWHDRAVFHFLTSPTDQHSYLARLLQATRAGSIVVMATFALDGRERCSGLEVQRYGPETLQARLGQDFNLIDYAPERHLTPRGVAQSFSYAVFART